VKVAQILQTKGAEVFSVSESQTIAEALELLDEKNIGAVVVKNGRDEVSGILSERDIVRRLRSQGPALMTSQVRACMTPNPQTCRKEDSVDELMTVMTNQRIRHLPVVEEGRLVGLVSIGDVVKRKIEEAEMEAASLRKYISS
jgi:CBS domain-containing protein